MRASAHASTTVPLPRETVFDYAVSNECFERDLHSYGPISGIKSGEMLDGEPLGTGARRRMTLLDGTVLVEDILQFDRPEVHRYRWTNGLKPPFSWLVQSGEGCFTFSDVESGTQVDWGYTFELRSFAFYPLAIPIVRLFQQWQKQGLAQVRKSLLASAD